MADTNKVRQDCSERVYRGGWRGSSCAKLGKVQRPVERRVYPDPVRRYDEEAFSFTEERLEPATVVEQRWFCATHDPVARAERDQRRRDEESRAWRTRQEREASYRDAAERIAKARQDVIDAAREFVEVTESVGGVLGEKFTALKAAVAALEAK